MALTFKQIHTEGIALLSYIVGDDTTGTAAVFDPRPDPVIYLNEARKMGVTITHIFETHIHADFMSGSRELALQTPGSKIFVSEEGDADYQFEHHTLRDGDRFTFGDTQITARHTPGHTPEHVSYELAEKDRSNDPWGVLTGDSLFVGSAGRPDLLGKDQSEELAGKLYETLYGYYSELKDSVIIYPGHGAGSPCGADIGARLMSTIGYEKRTNQFMQFQDQKNDFVDFALNAPDEPTYYQRMKKINASGPEPTNGLPRVKGFSPADFRDASSDSSRVEVIDTRSPLAFGGGHIQGAVNIWGKPMLSLWAGWLIDPDKEIYLVLDSDKDLNRIVRYLTRVGLTHFGGYLVGGMNAWATHGCPMSDTPQIPVHELSQLIDQKGDSFQLVDVRTEAEFKEDRIAGATHLFLPEIPDRAGQALDRNKRTVTYCESGYRAGIAASLLERAGFENVQTVPGSMLAWRNADC
ncbi:MAG: MBL fold metallo-hydrolase [Verrucomicrobiales bacterium]|nr:MBL fold metallo-hydrolase [Verrucomicrobiales bacterium]